MSEDLQSENYSQRLLVGLRSLQQDDLLSDLLLVADDQSIKVHRVVMAASSDYFRALLTHDMKEKDQSSIALKGVPIKGLKALVRFAYTGKLYCTLDNIADILLAATHLQFSEAIQLCSSYLTNLTNNINSVDMYNLAEQFGLQPLQNKAMVLILQNFEVVASTEDYYKFSDKFLNQILCDDRLRVYSELKLFQHVLRWVKYNEEQRTKHLSTLMSNIRFPLLMPQEIVEYVMEEPKMKSNPQCLDLILEANKYHMLPARQPLMQNNRTRLRNHTPSLVMLDIDEEGPRVFDMSSRNWGTLQFSAIETYHAQVCTLDNYMYVCGGIELYSSNNPVSGKSYRYDPRFNSWAEIAPLNQPRHHFTLVADKQSLFAIGGYSSGAHKNDVEQYIVEKNCWVSKNPMEVKLSAVGAAIHDRFIFVSGGQTDCGISRCLWCYHIDIDYWYGKSPMPSGRMEHVMECYKNKLYVLGGYDKNIIKAYDVDTVMCYDIELDNWSIIRDSCPRISSVSSCLIGSRIFTVGGFSYDENKKRNEILYYDIKTNDWQVMTKIHSPAMSVPCCALFLPRNMIRDISV